jgi:hypothetical protein
VHILLVNLCEQAYEYVFNENSTFQMVGSTWSTPNSFDVSGSGDLPPPPPMTPVETFMATQTEVLRHILQTQQQIAQQMQQRPPMGANHDGLQMVTTYSQFIGMKLKDQYSEPERGSEWEPIKILLEGDGNSNKMNTASNTRLRLITQIGQAHVSTGVPLDLGTNTQPSDRRTQRNTKPRVH